LPFSQAFACAALRPWWHVFLESEFARAHSQSFAMSLHVSVVCVERASLLWSKEGQKCRRYVLKQQHSLLVKDPVALPSETCSHPLEEEKKV